MEIRLAEIADLAAIEKYDSHIRRERLEACVKDQFVYVLCNGERIVGVLRYSLFWQSIPFLDLVYIDGAYQGKGFGSRMMAHWEAAMQSLHYSYVMLSTQADETAKDFYEKLGYHRIGAFLPPEQEAQELVYLKEIGSEKRGAL